MSVFNTDIIQKYLLNVEPDNFMSPILVNAFMFLFIFLFCSFISYIYRSLTDIVVNNSGKGSSVPEYYYGYSSGAYKNDMKHTLFKKEKLMNLLEFITLLLYSCIFMYFIILFFNISLPYFIKNNINMCIIISIIILLTYFVTCIYAIIRSQHNPSNAIAAGASIIGFNDEEPQQLED
jgi:hypothetical protein